MSRKHILDRYKIEKDNVIIEVSIKNSRQLFNEHDPAPFRDRDLDQQFVTYIVSLLIFILLCGVIPLYERKKLSLIQRRVGPKFTGFNGRLQFLADALKIFLKDFFFIFSVSKFSFFFLPVLTLFFNLFFLLSFQ